MVRTHLTRTRLGAVLAVAVGVLLGAVIGQPGNSRAAATAKPRNKTLPTISGTAEVGLTLVATRGTWSGSPTSFHYSWSRCDAAGAACLAISGATGKIGKDDTLFALEAGAVQFGQSRGRKTVNIVPAGA